jgi:citrate lyase subunit beta/citryl-CoA lyase
METPLAMLNAREIAQASTHQTCWVMGTNDIAKELGCAQTLDRQPMLTALSLCLLAARAYGLTVLDGVHNDFKNEEAFDVVAQQGRNFGFDGKTLIHPVQVGPCNTIFSPSSKEVEDAQAIIDGFKQAKAEGKGVVTVSGKMIEELHVEIAQKTVAVSHAIADMAEG